MRKSLRKQTMKIRVMILLAVSVWIACANAGCAKTSRQDISYEVHFLLDSEAVLDQDKTLKKEYETLFSLNNKAKAMEVMYFDTADQTFYSEGWVNRIRDKHKKKQALELTYKKRYPVNTSDGSDALKQAAKDGFDDTWEYELEWQYSGMTLSVSKSVKQEFDQSLNEMNTSELADWVKQQMPEEENNWNESHWGETAMASSLPVGPVTVVRYEGEAAGHSVQIEVWNADPVVITELSFSGHHLEKVSAKRDEIMKLLEEEDILLRQNTLKTERILSAYLK